MSVAIATMGYYTPKGIVQAGDIIEGGGSTPYAYGGGVHPGAVLPTRKRLKVTVKRVNTFRKTTEIKVQIK
jgi:hypothetical protein